MIYTEHYDLPQYQPNDKLDYLNTVNDAYQKLDSGLWTLKERIDKVKGKVDNIKPYSMPFENWSISSEVAYQPKQTLRLPTGTYICVFYTQFSTSAQTETPGYAIIGGGVKYDNQEVFR